MNKKVEKIFFDLEIIAFEFTVLKLVFTEREYISLGVNMLTNSLKISDNTKTEYLGLIFFLSDQKVWQKYCREDLSSDSDGPFNLLTVHKCSDTGFFRHLSNPAFGSL